MSTFERIYQTDPARESDQVRETLYIALSDQEYLERIRRDTHSCDKRKDIDAILDEKYPQEKIKKPKRTKKGIV